MSGLETLVNIPHSDLGFAVHFHASVTEWELCQNEIADARDAEARDEFYAEGAWLRAAEAGDPATWAAEDYDRLVELHGYGPPC